jgi:peptide/nickel transport system permease protein
VSSTKLEHYVSPEPFEPLATERLTPAPERFYRASQWKIMWWKFRRHRIAVFCAGILIAFYASILVSEFLAPYNLHTRDSRHIYAPPQDLQLFHEGKFVGPFVYGYSMELNMQTMRREFRPDAAKVQPLRFFCRGDEYEFWGLVEGSFHLVCPAEGGALYVFGTDRLGRDVLSRIVYGTRISLTVGLLGIAVSFVIGIVLGGISGYYGGWIDTVIQRFIEMVRSFRSCRCGWLVGGAAGELERAGLLRHHHHPGSARLAWPRARGALEAAGAARGGFRFGRGADGRLAGARDRSPPAAQLH